MSSFNINSIPDQVLLDVTESVTSSEQPIARRLCNVIDYVGTLSGTIPGLSAVTTLANAGRGGLRPGEAAPQAEAGMITTTYNCLRYHGEYGLTKEEMMSLAGFGVSTVELFMRKAVVDSNLQVDIDLALVLASQSLNRTYDMDVDGSGEWDDATNGRPIADIMAARKDKVPGADTLVLGMEVAHTLLRHPDFVAETSNFSAGQLSVAELSAVIRAKTGVPNVVILDKFYNTAARGLTHAIGYVGDTLAWLGHSSDLIMMRPTMDGQDQPYDAPVNNPPSHTFGYYQFCDIVRPNIDMGCTFLNIFT